jgi:dUTP pyrophosphatase
MKIGEKQIKHLIIMNYTMNITEFITEFITDFMNGRSNNLSNPNESFALLKIAVNPNNEELIELYKKHIVKHNESMKTEYYHNAGFDLFIPKEILFEKEITSKFIDLEIKTEMLYYENSSFKNCGYNMHPRSSISKTPLMLANHTGIVDSGYRGSLIGAFRWLKPTNNNDTSFNLEKHTRLLQICHPSLCRILVCLVEETELSTTERGEGGFGSTGIIGL